MNEQIECAKSNYHEENQIMCVCGISLIINMFFITRILFHISVASNHLSVKNQFVIDSLI